MRHSSSLFLDGIDELWCVLRLNNKKDISIYFMKREEILELVKSYYAEQFAQKDFEPGKTMIPFAGRIFDEEELVTLVDASLDFWLTTGRYAEEFEAKFASFMQQRSCMLVNSGSSANLVALSTLTSSLLKGKRLKRGDEVLTVAAGFPTTVNPVVQNGLIPVFVDVELDTFNVKVSEIENALSDKTKAIMLAHTLGNTFDLNAVKAIADKYKNDKMLIGYFIGNEPSRSRSELRLCDLILMKNDSTPIKRALVSFLNK